MDPGRVAVAGRHSGASRVATIDSSVRAASLRLDDRTRRELEDAFRELPA